MSTSKNSFIAFAEINEADTKNKTTNLCMGLDVTNVRKEKGGTVVSIGIGGDYVGAITTNQVMPILLIVNKDEYYRVQKQKSGIGLIAVERASQIQKWTKEHDQTHEFGELANVAAALCINGTEVKLEDPSNFIENGRDVWGLVEKLKEDRIKQLQVASALIAAEIDRILNK